MHILGIKNKIKYRHSRLCICTLYWSECFIH